jgi:methionyl-tRNA synthetase
LPDAALYGEFVAAGERIATLYETREYGTAIREIMELADRANRYVDQHKPWALARDPSQAEAVRAIATQGLNLFRVLMSYLAPVLPNIAQAAAAFLDTDFSDWNRITQPLLGSVITAYQPLATRLDPATVASLIEPGAGATPAPVVTATAAATKPPAPAPAAASASVGIEDFAKLELRVARVLKAEHVEGSSKLLRLTLDLGTEQRTVFSGIRAAYQPEQVRGRLVIVIANLAPRKMRFGISQGMVLCASGVDDSGGIFLLDADSGAQPGMKVT